MTEVQPSKAETEGSSPSMFLLLDLPPCCLSGVFCSVLQKSRLEQEGEKVQQAQRPFVQEPCLLRSLA